MKAKILKLLLAVQLITLVITNFLLGTPLYRLYLVKDIAKMSDVEFESFSEVEINKLKKELNDCPCPSGKEAETLAILKKFFKKNIPNARLYPNIGGEGLAVEFDFGGNQNKSVVFRGDMDAVPVSIPDSKRKYNHQCGHDGHMSILAKTALLLAKNPLTEGKVILLFQPAEETAQGAKAIINDQEFQKLIADFNEPKFIALHNLPGFSNGRVIVSSEKAFSSAVSSRNYKITGKSSHAANPEEGLNPVHPITEIIHELPRIQESLNNKDIWHKITVVHSEVGKEWNFGTSPADGELSLTFRAKNNANLAEVIKIFQEKLNNLLQGNHYQLETTIHDNFPATENDESLQAMLIRICKEKNIPIEYIKKANSWGEDFGCFLFNNPGLMFGLGSGESNTGLHTSTYKFPEEIIAVGAKLFYEIANNLLNAKHIASDNIESTSPEASMNQGLCLKINLDILHQNIKAKLRPDCKLIAVIKDNAYGLGAIKIAKQLIKEKDVAYLALARVSEALHLINAGINFENLILLEEMQSFEVYEIVKNNLITSVASIEAVQALQNEAVKQNKIVRVHIKVDTGLYLDGCEIDKVLDLLIFIKNNCSNIITEGIYTHFAEAESDNDYTWAQLNKFSILLAKLEADELKPPKVHVCNSAGIFNYPEAHFNYVRTGAALFGLIKQDGLEELASLTTHITNIRFLPMGCHSGYGHKKNIAKRDTWLAIVALGYGDGFPRDFHEEDNLMFYIKGYLAPLFGCMAMDKVAVDITHFYDSDRKNIKVGDPVLIFGKLGEQRLPICEAARSTAMIPAELLSHIAQRVPRVYSTSESPD